MNETLPPSPPIESEQAPPLVLRSPEVMGTNRVLTPQPPSQSRQPLSTTIRSLITIDPKAMFTDKTVKALKRCGIDPNKFDPIPYGKGVGHIVYQSKPSSNEEEVLKICRAPNKIYRMTEGYDNEIESLKLAREYFAPYIPKTEIYKDPQSDFSCTVQDKISEGKPLTNIFLHNNPMLLSQLQEIAQMNSRLYQESSKTLDFIGVNGFIAWLKELFSGYVQRKKECLVSNILVDGAGSLKIIDFEFFDLSKKVGFIKKLIIWFSVTTNRALMKHYTGLDILKQETIR